MPNPWVSLRCDQLIPVNKVVNEKEQLEKGLEDEKRRNFASTLPTEGSFLSCRLK
jgi:hypothetical protein